MQKRSKWFNEARYGLFIHWGAYSKAARGEWVMNSERIPLEEYTRYALYMAVMDDEICRNELEGNWIDGKEITFPPKMESLQQRYHTAIWRPPTRRALPRPSWPMPTALSAACPTGMIPCSPATAPT